MDAIVFYNQLRKAGVGLHTCCEGSIDLEDFAKQLLLFINQKASNDFLVEMQRRRYGVGLPTPRSEATTEGWQSSEWTGACSTNTGICAPAPTRRVHPAGRAPGPSSPCTDQAKIDAVQFAFNRFADADLGVRDLARELETKGYQSPTGKGWTHHNVGRLLRTTAYVGTAQWGAKRGASTIAPKARTS